MVRVGWGVLLAIFLAGAGSAQNGLVTVGPGGTSNGAVTLYGATNSSAAITVNSSGPGSTTAILPFINGGISLESIPLSNLGDMVCAMPQDSLANIKTGSFGSVVVTSGGSGYVVNGVLTFSAPPTTGGVTATAKVTSVGAGGVITGVAITNPGSGYTSTTSPGFTGGSGTGALLTVSSCGAGAGAAGSAVSFVTTCMVPASLLLTNPHLHITAGFQYWAKTTSAGPIIMLSAGSTPIYSSGSSPVANAATGLGTAWSWDIFAPSTVSPTTASLICSPSAPSISGLPAGQIANTVAQPVVGVFNLQNAITLTLAAEYGSGAPSGTGMQLLWLSVEVL